MEKKIYRVGIIGTGGIARFHSGGYKVCAQTEIVAACDIREEQVKKYGQELNVTALYSSYFYGILFHRFVFEGNPQWVNYNTLYSIAECVWSYFS